MSSWRAFADHATPRPRKPGEKPPARCPACGPVHDVLSRVHDPDIFADQHRLVCLPARPLLERWWLAVQTAVEQHRQLARRAL